MVKHPFGMLSIEEIRKITEDHQEFLKCNVQEFKVGNQFFSFNQSPSLMGVINLSPDSWYRESVCLSTEQAIQRGQCLHAEGAKIIDIGAESSLAHASLVDEELQKSRLLPVIRELASQKILVSAETYHSKVARMCVEAGASVLNLTGSVDLDEIFRVAAERQAAVILCYVEGENVRKVGDFSFEPDMIPKMYDYFAKKIDQAVKVGVTRIIIDPGLGFYYRNLQDSSKRIGYQMKTFLNTFRLRKLGWPICQALPHAFEFFEDEVRIAEAFFAVLALLGKTNILRTHEVKKVRGVLLTMECWTSSL
jgi:dihydropteroate synthase